MARVMIPNEVWSAVCLYRLLRTTSATSPRFRSMTMRRPSRSDSVAKVRDSLDRLVAHELGDLLDELRLVDLVRDLGHDDRRPIALRRFLDGDPGPDRDRPAAGLVGLHDAGASTIRPAVGKSGPGTILSKPLELRVSALAGVLKSAR